MMMSHTFPKLVIQILVTFGLILVSSHVGECKSNKMFLSVDVGFPLEPSPAPAPAPAPGPAPGQPPFYPNTSGLKVGFYQGKCPNVVVDVEAIIYAKIQEIFNNDPTVLPALLRLQFHDCFVKGCDASILISGNSTERMAGPNSSVRGFDVIDSIKAAVEAECPGVVSCADVLVVATSIVLELGGGPSYSPETGRRDALESHSYDVNLPNPTFSAAESVAFFAARNFTAEEMVVLLGCHSVGVTHCGLFQNRLYPNSGQYDPLMDPTLRASLTTLCPQGTFTGNTTPLNQDLTNNNTVDTTFYNQLILERGILPVDQALSREDVTSAIVLKLSQNPTLFNLELAKVMIKLQAFQVLTGTQGEIRTVCSIPN